MWDAIERNKRRSWILIVLMGLLLSVFGYLLGGALYLQAAVPRDMLRGYRDLYGSSDQLADPYAPEINAPRFFAWLDQPGALWNSGGMFGLFGGTGLAAAMGLYGWHFGDRSLLRAAKATPVTKERAPKLYNVVEEMTIAAGLPQPPEVYVIDDDAPNAFATGRNPGEASVAVTRGLLSRLDRDELQGVIAHEIGHIHNYDIRFMTLAATVLGSIVLVSELFWRSLRYMPRRSSRSKGGAQIAYLILAIILAILAPIFARLLYFACSRRREYLADASAAAFTRYPEGLARALEKIGKSAQLHAECSHTLAPLYIVNPLQSQSFSTWFSSHPPLDQRIRVLREMGGMAGFLDYEAAFRKVSNGRKCMSESFLKSQDHASAKPAAFEEPRVEAVARKREALGLLDQAAGIIPILCACGIRLKAPPGFKSKQAKCPKCGRMHAL